MTYNFNNTSTGFKITGIKIALGLTILFICLIIFGCIVYLIYTYFLTTSSTPQPLKAAGTVARAEQSSDAAGARTEAQSSDAAVAGARAGAEQSSVAIPVADSDPEPDPNSDPDPVADSDPEPDAALATGAGSKAAQPLNYINGRYVKLSLTTTNGALNIAEVEIYTNDERNIALDPQTIIYQSSILDNNGFKPSYINDANYEFGFHSNVENNPWIKLDLGSEKPITKIIVIPRLDCCQSRTKGLVLTISDSADTKIIYTGDKIADINGDTTYEDNGDSGNMYNIYTYTMPSTKAVGSNF